MIKWIQQVNEKIELQCDKDFKDRSSFLYKITGFLVYLIFEDIPYWIEVSSDIFFEYIAPTIIILLFAFTFIIISFLITKV